MVHQFTPRRWGGVMGVCVGRVIKVIPLHMIPCTQSGQAVPNVARPKKMSDGDVDNHDDVQNVEHIAQ